MEDQRRYPSKKGYHTANLIGDKMVVFGGSDGHASFADVHVLNLSECEANQHRGIKLKLTL